MGQDISVSIEKIIRILFSMNFIVHYRLFFQPIIVIVAAQISNSIAVPSGKGTFLFSSFFLFFEDDLETVRLPTFILFPSHFFLPSSPSPLVVYEQSEYTSCSATRNNASIETWILFFSLLVFLFFVLADRMVLH